MVTILNEKKSTAGSPFVFYSINGSVLERRSSEVDLQIQVTSHLQYSNSSLYSGVLTGYLKINGKEHVINLKSKSESWTGTTKHTTTKQITVDDLTGSQELLEDITFRVTRETGSTSSSGYLATTVCSDIKIPIGHTAPNNITYTVTEENEKLTALNISNDVFVENLSIKKFLFDYDLYDNATLSRVSIFNGASAVYSSNTNPLIVNLKTQPFPSKNEEGKINIKAKVTDSLEGSSFAEGDGWDLYNVIPYTVPNFNEALTTFKRNGQLSGKALINLSGTFFKGQIGNLNQSKASIKYKFWENLSSVNEPTIYDYIVPDASITYSNNTLSISDLEIGSDDETSNNYFDPKKSYKIKFLIEDNFNIVESNTKSISVGEATWTEYKDRVDFKKVTIQGKDIVSDIIYNDNQVLWDPGEGEGYYVSASHNIKLSQKISEQKNGIVLVWQAYSDGAAQAWEINMQFIPKWFVKALSSKGVSFLLSDSNGARIGIKYVYVFDDHITGRDSNADGATKKNSGLTTTNKNWVLTKVIGV